MKPNSTTKGNSSRKTRTLQSRQKAIMSKFVSPNLKLTYGQFTQLSNVCHVPLARCPVPTPAPPLSPTTVQSSSPPTVPSTSSAGHQRPILPKKMTPKEKMAPKKKMTSKEEKPFECSKCSKRFREKGNLIGHMNGVHQMGKQLTCGDCGKTFFWKLALERHLLLHTRERPHKCRICQKTFNRLDSCRGHEKTHQGKLDIMILLE